jgi:hypothetical protein
MRTGKIVKWDWLGVNFNQRLNATSEGGGGAAVARINLYPGAEAARQSKHLLSAKTALTAAHLPASSNPLAFLTDKLKEIPVSVVLKNDQTNTQNVLFYVRFSGKNETFAVTDSALAETAGTKAALSGAMVFSSEQQDQQVLGALVCYIRQRAAGKTGKAEKQQLEQALDCAAVPELACATAQQNLATFLTSPELKQFLEAIGCQLLESYIVAKSQQVDEIVAVMFDCLSSRSDNLLKNKLRELARIEKNIIAPLNVSPKIEQELLALSKNEATNQVKRKLLDQIVKKILNGNEGLLGCVKAVYEQQVKALNSQAEQLLRESPVAKKLTGLMKELGRELPKNVSIEVFNGRLEDLKKLMMLPPNSDRQTIESAYREVISKGHLTAEEASAIQKAWEKMSQRVGDLDISTLYLIFRKVLGYGAELHLVEKTEVFEAASFESW